MEESKSKKIIFLDVDGVLNTERYRRIQAKNHAGVMLDEFNLNFDPVATANLKQLIQETEAELVITSTWRIGKLDTKYCFLWNHLERNLSLIALKHKVLDVTPLLYSVHTPYHRWHEIQHWLEANQHLSITQFVIIDDAWDMGIYNDHHFARCWSYTGLTHRVKQKALEILMHQNSICAG